MAELLTLGTNLSSSVDPIAPLTNPDALKPTDTSLAPQVAANAAGAAATNASQGAVGILNGSVSVKNLLFVGIISFLIFKYGRKYIA